jgi:hypothetical protein
MNPPELAPEIRGMRLDVRVSREHATGVGPIGPRRHQSCALWIFADISGDILKSAALALIGPEDMIESLMLQRELGTQASIQVAPQESDREFLVGLRRDSHAQEMKVIGHEAVNGAMQSEPAAGMKEQEPKVGVEFRDEPAPPAGGDRHRPMHPGNAAVVIIGKPAQVAFAMRWPGGEHGLRA